MNKASTTHEANNHHMENSQLSAHLADEEVEVVEEQLDTSTADGQLTVAINNVDTVVPQQDPPGARKLTAAHAVDIYLRKNERAPTLSKELAQQYGVTTKAIRDVWARRTWMNETMPYWPIIDEQAQLQVDHEATGTTENGSLFGAVSQSGTGDHECSGTLPASSSKMASLGNEEHRQAMCTTNDLDPPEASFSVDDPTDSEEWDILPFDSYLVPGCLLRQVCETSPARAAQEFPHAQVVDDAQRNEDGWLIDPTLISHFASQCRVAADHK